MKLDTLFFDTMVLKKVQWFLKNPKGGLILYGSKGLGKHLLARFIAMQVLGVNEMEQLSFHLDFMEIHLQNQSIKVDDLEPVHKLVALTAVNAEKKVVVIDDADKMTTVAQNSLLKLLEDMNEKNLIILVCHRPILQTIHSRCQIMECYLSNSNNLFHYLTLKGLVVEELALILANGCIGKYFTYCQREEYLRDIRSFFLGFSKNSKKELLTIFSMMKEKDKNNFFEKYVIEDIREFLQLLFEVLNEMLLRLSTKSEYQKEFSTFIDFEVALQHTSIESIIKSQQMVKEHLFRLERKGTYTKHDFFDLIRHL